MMVRILDSDDAAEYRKLRMRALSLNPESFLTTYDDYVKRPLEQVSMQLKPADGVFTLGVIQVSGIYSLRFRT